MSSLISILPAQSTASDRISEAFSTASALLSGFVLLLAVAVAF